MADPSSDYQVLEELGSGSFGVVFKGIEKKSGELVALKLIDLDGTDDDIRDIQQEISLLSACASPYVTQYITSFVRGTKLWIVMEFLGGGSCLDLVKIAPFDEHNTAILCRELLLGLDYLHSTGKIHRDIKAANILLSHKGKVKIADFGVAAQLTNIKSQRNTFVGTPFWMAPEVIQEAGYDYKADIWSLGITAIELVMGEPPNAEIHPMKALFQIPKSPPPRLQGMFSRELKSFVAACLVKDPTNRPTAKDLLQHRFIKQAGRVSGLQHLVESRQMLQAKSSHATHPKFYEETLRDMAPAQTNDDDWVFDTIRPSTVAYLKHTVKKVKTAALALPQLEPPSEMMERLDLNPDSSKLRPAPSGLLRPQHPLAPTPETIRPIRQRDLSVATARKVSNTARKVSPRVRRVSAQKQPLALDMSFGNSKSSARPFRRVSDDSPTALAAPNENIPPVLDSPTKEAKIGRKVFSRIIDPAFQELYAQTADKAQQKAVSKVGQAWAALDALDPDGEFLLMKLILEKVQSEPKLANLLLPGSTPNTPQKQKLVLSQNNPHLKSHRYRQSSQASQPQERSPNGLPGQVVLGLEHNKQFADILYGRWLDGLKSRWLQV